jgi:autotransporter-associated beta strand protein
MEVGVQVLTGVNTYTTDISLNEGLAKIEEVDLIEG